MDDIIDKDLFLNNVISMFRELGCTEAIKKCESTSRITIKYYCKVAAHIIGCEN